MLRNFSPETLRAARNLVSVLQEGCGADPKTALEVIVGANIEDVTGAVVSSNLRVGKEVQEAAAFILGLFSDETLSE